MFIVYIIQSDKSSRYYIGHTQNISERLKRHNRSGVKSTKYGIPWKVVYTEKHKNKSDAFKREMQIKGFKGGILFQKLLK